MCCIRCAFLRIVSWNPDRRGSVAGSNRHVDKIESKSAGTSLPEGRDFGVMGAKSWRLADLGAKHALLPAGVGWGNMPRSFTMISPPGA
jgi:hypothetical protein